MQEPEAHLANARFARRHLSKMAGIGLAALVATLTMPKPVQARQMIMIGMIAVLRVIPTVF